MRVSEPIVYVVVLNWNLKDDTAETVASVYRSTYPNLRILVVDNGSSDGSTEFLREKFPNLDIVSLDKNVGYAAGNNVGIRRAQAHSADYVLLLNNDTVVDPDCIENLVVAAESEEQLGIVAPVVYYHDHPNKVWQCGAKDRIFPPLPVQLTLRDLQRSERTCRDLSLVDYVTGCAMLVKRNAFDDIGLLDEHYFVYYEDSDFCIRARARGHKIGIACKAKIWHKVAASTKRAVPSKRYISAKSRITFYRRHNTGFRSVVVALFLIASSVRAISLDLAGGHLDLVRAHLLGLFDGLTGRISIREDF